MHRTEGGALMPPAMRQELNQLARVAGMSLSQVERVAITEGLKVVPTPGTSPGWMPAKEVIT